jgi:predicted flap endonuclease-1-like 5' DNA nuclease
LFLKKMSLKQKVSVSPISSSDWCIEQLPGLSQQEQAQLQNCGITTTAALVKQGKTPADRLVLANKLQVHLQYVNKWVALADLARIPGVGTQYCGLLLHAGIASVVQLAATPTHRLHQQLLRLVVATMQRRDLCPSIEQVQQWSQQAKTVLSNER